MKLISSNEDVQIFYYSGKSSDTPIRVAEACSASHQTLLRYVSGEEPREPKDTSEGTTILSLFMFPLTSSSSTHTSALPPRVTRVQPRQSLSPDQELTFVLYGSGTRTGQEEEGIGKAGGGGGGREWGERKDRKKAWSIDYTAQVQVNSNIIVW